MRSYDIRVQGPEHFGFPAEYRQPVSKELPSDLIERFEIARNGYIQVPGLRNIHFIPYNLSGGPILTLDQVQWKVSLTWPSLNSLDVLLQVYICFNLSVVLCLFSLVKNRNQTTLTDRRVTAVLVRFPVTDQLVGSAALR